MLEASDTLAGAVTELAAGNVGTTCGLGRIIDDPLTPLMILSDLERIGHGMDLDGFIQHVKAQAGELGRRRA
jgi:hypothetical protein